ncbi:xanthine dehydrogenase family protein molybdopterin-binding subunit [Acidicapsa acidisoli]|uniref:xanthine dehydrogenase family protein molybdopterin-binding subunit n=1 Tax=Acidicapsa acidisoli TaxID=1615681 RepID=UPI0021DFB5C2|nr:molybdopterin cofactor-binding domain-containing protein [Acidicapsa acidisoli]
MIAPRREFLKGAGVLIVGLSSNFLAFAQEGQFGTHRSHVDPDKLDSWIAINSDGTVTAFTGKCDLGQGIFTAQSQLIAEELCVPLQAVRLVQCDTDVTPDQGSTSGSQSTPTNFNVQDLALAAATAREALIGMAALQFGEDERTLTAIDGAVRSPGGRQITYASLIGTKKFSLPVNKEAKRRSPKEWTILGKPVRALDHAALMTGGFEFVQNVRVPGMLHGRVVRPPAMGATLLSADKASITGIPGVVAVVVREDFVGIVAETQFAAVQAARRLVCRWNPGPALPPQDRFFDHMQQQPSHDELSVDSGDVADGLQRAHHVLHARYTYPYQMHGSLGSSCAVADVKSDHAVVWSPTQSVYPTRNCIAMLLNMPPDRVRVIFVRGSGCYGLNGADAVSFDAAVLSQAVGRPVRLQYTRQDEMMWENFGNACVIEHRVGLDADGSIVAWDRENWVANRGSRPGYDKPGNVISGMLLGYDPEPLKPTPAKAPTRKLRNGSNTVPEYVVGCAGGVCSGSGTVKSERVLTHTVASPFYTGPLRSPLRIQNTFANECFMDELAYMAGADPVEYRLRHLHDERVRGVLQTVAKAANWQARSVHRKSASGHEEVTGRGVACVAYEGDNGYAALIADLAVNLRTGVVRPIKFTIAIDCGPISNPDGLRNQVEGGLLQGMSRSLVEEVTWDAERVTSVDWEGYTSLRLDYNVPAIETIFVVPDDVSATGAGETSITVAPAAIGNAIFDATGVRLRHVPFTPARLLAAIHRRFEATSV